MAANSTYVPPGVSITEITQQSVTPDIVTGTNLCLVGVPGTNSSGVSPVTITDTVLFGVNNAPVVLPTIASINNDAVLVQVLSMVDVLNPSYPAGVPFTQVATLSSALTTSTAITSLPAAVTKAIPTGTTLQIVSGSNNQIWTTTSAVAAGATTIPVSSQTPNYAYPSGSVVQANSVYYQNGVTPGSGYVQKTVITGTLTSGQATVTGTFSSAPPAGAYVTGTGIPANTQILGTPTPTATGFTLSNNATSTGSQTLTYGDFSVQAGEGPPDGGINPTTPSASTGTITPLQGGAFNPSNDGATWAPRLVNVTYTYTPVDYFNPVRMYDIGSVQARFGNAWSTATLSNGLTVYTGVNSPLSLAAAFAFQNGAQSVVLQPLFQRATPGNQATAQEPATGTAIGNAQTWMDTLANLRNVTNIDVIVPVVGFDNSSVTSNAQILAIFEAVQAHQAYMASQNDFIFAVFGEDGTYNSAQLAALSPPTPLQWTHAAALQSAYGNAYSQYSAFINNSAFTVSVPGAQGGSLTIGGQYAAAAFAGALVSRSTSSSMTRQYLSGFSSIVDKRTPADKNNDAGSGLCVLENFNNGIRCRQGITLDILDGPAGQEISVVRSQFVMIESIQQTLDSQIIGQIIANANSPMVVETAISSVLSLLQGSNVIVGFTAPQATLTSLNPTTISASFSYQPAFPLNFIQITFSTNLSTGATTVSVSHQSPSFVNNPSYIQPMDEPYVVEILTPVAAGVGTLVLNLYDLWSNNDTIVTKIWDRLGNTGGTSGTTPSVVSGQDNAGLGYGSTLGGGGIFGQASDIVDIAIAQAQATPYQMSIVQYIRQIPNLQGGVASNSSPTLTGGKSGYITYHGCTITDVRDDETVQVGTLEVVKQITVNYTYSTRSNTSSTNWALALRHRFTLQTLRPEYTYAIAQVVQPYRNTFAADKAWRNAHVACALTSVDGNSHFCDPISDRIEDFVLGRFNYVSDKKTDVDLINFEREENFKQRVFAASQGPYDPMLYPRIFDPEVLIEKEEIGDTDFYQPQDLNELWEMMEGWEAMDSLAALASTEEASLPDLDPEAPFSFDATFVHDLEKSLQDQQQKSN
ncbi:unnamed protein product [Sphagnum balticum]